MSSSRSSKQLKDMMEGDSSEETEVEKTGSSESSDGDNLEGVVDEASSLEQLGPLLKIHFQVLSTEQVVQHMEDSIREVNLVLQLPPSTAGTLLMYFRWDREKLLEKYYDDDLDKLFREARVVNPDRSRTPPILAVAPSGGVEHCEICYTKKASSMMYGMGCGHRFCLQCWSEYLTTKILQEGDCQTISCAAHDCSIIVDDATVLKLVTEPKVLGQYRYLCTNRFVEYNRLMRWCPSPGCTNAIRVEWVGGIGKPVTCSCGHIFCFQCGNNWHDPVPCDWLQKWLKKCVDDTESSNWIAVHAKECPKCKIPIEKSGGCNIMVCSNKNCNAVFCWRCLSLLGCHSHASSCNKYEEPEGVRDSPENDASAALNRYLFYRQRYENHNQSEEYEKQLRAWAGKKMEELRKYEKMPGDEVQFLNKAVDVICQCRKTLTYSYVFAFYLEKCGESEFFVENQRGLESATDKLGEYLEGHFASYELAGMKTEVEDAYRFCERRRKVLLEHVYEGRECGWWVYKEH